KNISGDSIEELVFGDMKMLIGAVDEYNIVTLHAADESDAIDKNREVTDLIRQNVELDFNDGFLSLIKELTIRNSELREKVDTSVKEWTESERFKSLKSAKDWGNTVF
ncbi:MAG: hypothetical protein ACW98Y_14730, partial [Candidatus Thorarchaeota archaeon]